MRFLLSLLLRHSVVVILFLHSKCTAFYNEGVFVLVVISALCGGPNPTIPQEIVI